MTDPSVDAGGAVRILGVDPGSRITGWGLVGGTVARPRVIGCGLVRLTQPTFADRLHRLQQEMNAVVQRCAPTVCAVEAPFHGASARSALQLAHARGVILAVLAGSGLSVVEYSPAAVKKAVTGNGRAEKLQVGRMVRAMLGSPAEDQPSDVADALAVGLCHLAGGRFVEAVSRARARAVRSRA